MSSDLGLPVLAADCPFRAADRRDRMAPVIAELSSMDTLVRENIYRACFGFRDEAPDARRSEEE
jgi:hypothetical protein